MTALIKAAASRNIVANPANPKAETALFRIGDIAAKIQQSADDKYQPRGRGYRGVAEMGIDQHRRNDDHELFERVHVGAETAFELGMPGGRRRLHVEFLSRASHGDAESHEFRQHQHDDYSHQFHIFHLQSQIEFVSPAAFGHEPPQILLRVGYVEFLEMVIRMHLAHTAGKQPMGGYYQ